MPETIAKNVKSIEYLKDTFKIGYTAFEESRIEAQTVWDMYHNRHYTADQLAILANRGQPAETFNVIKLFTRMLMGYYSTVVNTVVANPVAPEDAPSAAMLNDTITYTIRNTNFAIEGTKVKLSGIITGLMCTYVTVEETGESDQYGRPFYKILLEHVPDDEIVLDPMSRKDDYSDARYIHRWKWVSEEAIVELFGEEAVAKLTEYYNFTQESDTDYDQNGKQQEVGLFRIHNNYLLVHSIVKDAKGKTYSIYWNDDVILQQDEITYKQVPFPYRVLKVNTSNRNEYYGIFREVMETQKAINQALIKLQLLVNTQKAFVQDGAVENLADFTNAFNRVTAVIPVLNLKGIRIENLGREALEQYQVIDRGFDRVQRILNINDSFLGMAFASDSGRKVKLQKDSSIVALRYLTERIEAFYHFLGWDIANLIKQYFTAHQVLRIADHATGTRWAEINKPLQTWTGQIHPQTGQPIMQTEYEEHLDPETGEPMVDDKGNRIIAPIPEKGTEFAFTNVEIEIIANSYNDEDEKNQLMLENVLSGNIGMLLSQVNPAGFFQAAGLSMQTMKTKNSPEIARILSETAQMLGGNPEANAQASIMAQNMPGTGGGPSSKTLNLPQNTNEGL